MEGLQLDCDWTATTEDSFFELCKHVRNYIRNNNLPWNLCSTIRLHQLNRKAPPVDYGVLMVYNTGSFRNALGRRNSFEECWALTQYWRGWVPRFIPMLNYWEDTEATDNKYDFIYDYETTVGHYSTWDKFYEELDEAYNTLSYEAKAQVQYMFGNLKTIIRQSPDTGIAEIVKKSCDGWSNWL